MRLFISVNFDETTKDNILAIQSRLKQLTQGIFCRRENFHLTLAFLGEMDNNQLKTVCRVMDNIGVGDINLEFTDIGCFRRDGGDIWWLGIAHNPQLIALQKDLAARLTSAGLLAENRRFSPHITLCRQAKSPLSSQQRGSLLKEKFSCTASHISLMSSQRIDGILTYKERYRIPR